MAGNTLYYGDNLEILQRFHQVGATFKKAERHRPKNGKQLEILEIIDKE